MNLISLATKLAAKEQSAVSFDRERCLHSSDIFSNCTACFDVCPAGAIQIEQLPQFEAAACQHCFACLPLCPTGAYAMEDELPHVRSCLASLHIDTLELLCQHHPTSELGLSSRTAAIQVQGCLAGLGVAAYLQLATTSLKRVVVRTDPCAACSWQTLPHQVRKQISQAQQWLRGWQRVDFVQEMSTLGDPVKRPVYRAGAPPVSRRDLFRGWVQERPPVDITSSLNPFHQRLRMINALKQLPAEYRITSVPAPAESGFATLQIGETCNTCGTCVRACPSGALGLERDDENQYFQLTFALQACLACEVCAHVCPEQAVIVNHEATSGQILNAPAELVLLEGCLAQCRRCKGSFSADSLKDGFCSVCAFRRSNPFASRIPARPLTSDANSPLLATGSREKR